MLTNLHLENFKGFQTADIPLLPVTLLTGLNSSGKSSVIQALLLLKQIDYQRDPSTDHFELFPNGPYVSLGSGRDVLHEFAETDSLTLAFANEKREFSWRFNYQSQTHRLITPDTFEREDARPLDALDISYLSAERWGPRVTYPYEDAEQEKGLGIFGQYAMRYLIDHGEDPVECAEARHPDAKGIGLLHQVQAWLGEISPGVRIDVHALREAGLSVAGFGFERRGDVSSRYYRPTHVGFGLTYSLPLLVALLASTRGSILLLENPEAHLHPRAQSVLARLIALASTRIQVLLETHSDHIMNGLRVAVKRGELPTSRVAFHYLSRDGTTCSIQSPQIDQDGRLNSWPDGFFGEHERALAALVRKKST
jgi:predicted ATPase